MDRAATLERQITRTTLLTHFAGMMDLLQSEAELAAIIAHETAHVLARHHAEQLMHVGKQFVFVPSWG